MARIPDETREAILADVQAGEPRNIIARRHGVAMGTVTNIANAAGVTAGDRSQTKKATEAHQIDTKAVKAKMAKGSLAMAQTVLDSFADVNWNSVGPYQRALVFGILIDKAADLTRDEAEGFAAVDGWLRSMLGD